MRFLLPQCPHITSVNRGMPVHTLKCILYLKPTLLSINNFGCYAFMRFKRGLHKNSVAINCLAVLDTRYLFLYSYCQIGEYYTCRKNYFRSNFIRFQTFSVQYLSCQEIHTTKFFLRAEEGAKKQCQVGQMSIRLFLAIYLHPSPNLQQRGSEFFLLI